MGRLRKRVIKDSDDDDDDNDKGGQNNVATRSNQPPSKRRCSDNRTTGVSNLIECQMTADVNHSSSVINLIEEMSLSDDQMSGGEAPVEHSDGRERQTDLFNADDDDDYIEKTATKEQELRTNDLFSGVSDDDDNVDDDNVDDDNVDDDNVDDDNVDDDNVPSISKNRRRASRRKMKNDIIEVEHEEMKEAEAAWTRHNKDENDNSEFHPDNDESDDDEIFRLIESDDDKNQSGVLRYQAWKDLVMNIVPKDRGMHKKPPQQTRLVEPDNEAELNAEQNNGESFGDNATAANKNTDATQEERNEEDKTRGRSQESKKTRLFDEEDSDRADEENDEGYSEEDGWVNDIMTELTKGEQSEYMQQQEKRLHTRAQEQINRSTASAELQEARRKRMLLTMLRFICPQQALWTGASDKSTINGNINQQLIPFVEQPEGLRITATKKGLTPTEETMQKCGVQLQTSWAHLTHSSRKWCSLEGLIGPQKKQGHRERLIASLESTWLGGPNVEIMVLDRIKADELLRSAYPTEMKCLDELANPTVEDILETRNLVENDGDMRRWMDERQIQTALRAERKKCSQDKKPKIKSKTLKKTKQKPDGPEKNDFREIQSTSASETFTSDKTPVNAVNATCETIETDGTPVELMREPMHKKIISAKPQTAMNSEILTEDCQESPAVMTMQHGTSAEEGLSKHGTDEPKNNCALDEAIREAIRSPAGAAIPKRENNGTEILKTSMGEETKTNCVSEAAVANITRQQAKNNGRFYAKDPSQTSLFQFIKPTTSKQNEEQRTSPLPVTSKRSTSSSLAANSQQSTSAFDQLQQTLDQTSNHRNGKSDEAGKGNSGATETIEIPRTDVSCKRVHIIDAPQAPPENVLDVHGNPDCDIDLACRRNRSGDTTEGQHNKQPKKSPETESMIESQENERNSQDTEKTSESQENERNSQDTERTSESQENERNSQDTEKTSENEKNETTVKHKMTKRKLNKVVIDEEEKQQLRIDRMRRRKEQQKERREYLKSQGFIDVMAEEGELDPSSDENNEGKKGKKERKAKPQKSKDIRDEEEDDDDDDDDDDSEYEKLIEDLIAPKEADSDVRWTSELFELHREQVAEDDDRIYQKHFTMDGVRQAREQRHKDAMDMLLGDNGMTRREQLRLQAAEQSDLEQLDEAAEFEEALAELRRQKEIDYDDVYSDDDSESDSGLEDEDSDGNSVQEDGPQFGGGIDNLSNVQKTNKGLHRILEPSQILKNKQPSHNTDVSNSSRSDSENFSSHPAFSVSSFASSGSTFTSAFPIKPIRPPPPDSLFSIWPGAAAAQHRMMKCSDTAKTLPLKLDSAGSSLMSLSNSFSQSKSMTDIFRIGKTAGVSHSVNSSSKKLTGFGERLQQMEAESARDALEIEDRSNPPQ